MPRYTFKEFKSDQEVRWCPGCGDHGVLAALQRALPDVTEALGYSKERYVVVSGIGCSSRLPYYMNTYGFHSIHGRATAISTGIKVANPDLTVWQACGDGDALAIGGNHFIHAIRRNVDINIILFNNQIYGLTKGQYSPTSRFGAISKTSPYGTVEHPFNPGSLVLGAKGTFFARSLDSELKLSSEIMLAAAKHDGCSVMEMLTNCVIFNDGAHKLISDREYRADRTIILRHDAHSENVGIHMMLADMKYPEFPVALGIIRDVKDVTYDDGVRDQVAEVKAKSKIQCVDDLLRSGSTWEVK